MYQAEPVPKEQTQVNIDVQVQDLARLLDLARRARHVGSDSELAFLLVNDTHELTPYRQSVLWSSKRGVLALSGLLQAEANAPYVHWLAQLLEGGKVGPGRFNAATAPAQAASDWADWWPAEALCLPVTKPMQGKEAGGDPSETVNLVLVRDEVWTDTDLALLQEWLDSAAQAYWALARGRQKGWRTLSDGLKRLMLGRPGRAWWKGPLWIWVVAVAFVLAMPVPLSVLAPGELVPAHPTVVRAP